MKKLASLAIMGVLIIGSISAIGLLNVQSATVTSNVRLTVPELSVRIHQQYFIDLELENTNTYHMEGGKPLLPKMVESLELPFGARNIQVKVIPREVDERTVSALVRPAPMMIPLTTSSGSVLPQPLMDADVYNQESYYPSTWYDVSVGCGLDGNGEHITHVIVHFYPVRYAPALNTLAVANQADIRVSYEQPTVVPFPAVDTYELVIIAPSDFSSRLDA